jgi:hypothetical protein
MKKLTFLNFWKTEKSKNSIIDETPIIKDETTLKIEEIKEIEEKMKNDKIKYENLETEICNLRHEITILRDAMTTQKLELEENFKKQKEYLMDGIKQILLTLENEKLNNDRLMLEIKDLRDKNSILTIENVRLKNVCIDKKQLNYNTVQNSFQEDDNT